VSARFIGGNWRDWRSTCTAFAARRGAPADGAPAGVAALLEFVAFEAEAVDAAVVEVPA
jgi:hypothetical protein